MTSLAKNQEEKLSKYNAGDLNDPKKRKEISEIKPDLFQEISRSSKKILKHNAKKEVQPFITNDKLEEILKSQTPRWVNIAVLIISFLSLIITILSIFCQRKELVERLHRWIHRMA